MTVSARLSLAITVQAMAGGEFPSLTTYPASFERLLLAGESTPKVAAATGTIPAAVGSTPGTVAVSLPAGMTRARYVFVENLADPSGTGAANLTVTGPAGLPAGTLGRGGVLFTAAGPEGWAGGIVLGGTAGTAFKAIILGD